MTDSIDKGKLKYSVVVEDAFSPVTRAFREEMAQSEAAWQSFKTSASDAAGIGAGMRAFVQASQQAAKATEQQAAATDKLNDANKIREAAEAKVIAAVQKKLVQAEAERVSAEQGINLVKQKAEALTVEQRAQQSLATLVEKRAVASRVQALADEQGIRLTQTKAEVLSFEEQAQSKLVDLVEKRALASRVQALADEQGIRIAATKAEVLTVQQQAEQRLQSIIDKRVLTSEVQRLADESGINLTESKVEILSVQEKIEQQLLATQQRLEQAQVASSNQHLAKLQAELEALNRVSRAEQERLVRASLTAQGRGPSGALDETRTTTVLEDAQAKFAANLRNLQVKSQLKDIEAASPVFQELKASLDETDSAAAKLATSFTRIFASFLIFEAIRTVISAFRSLVTTALDFNRVMETTTLSLTSIFLATGQVVNTQGQLVKGAEAFAIAQGEARRQTDLLRQDSLAARSSFEGIVKVFQVGLAPGLRAGLGLDQIRQLSVQLTDAAAALGIQENQIADDIRGLLTGQINKRTNRVAASLGIDSEDIKRLKDADQLFAFLQQRFAAFNLTGKESLTTFDGALSKVKDVFEQIIGLGTKELFNSLKAIISDIFHAITVPVEGGFLKPNPSVVAFFTTIAAAASDVLASLRATGKEIDLAGLRAVAVDLVDAFAAISKILLGAVAGFFNGLGDLARVANVLRNSFGDLLSASTGGAASVGAIVKLLVEAATVLKGIQITTTAIAAIYALLVSPIGAIAIGLIFAAVAVKAWADSVTGIDTKFETIAKIISGKIVFNFEKLIFLAKNLVNIMEIIPTIQDSLEKGDLAGFAAQIQKVRDLKTAFEDLNNQQRAAFETAKANNDSASDFAGFMRKAIDAGKAGVGELLAQFPAIQELMKTRTQEAAQVAVETAKGAVIPPAESFLKALADAFGKNFKDVFTNIKDQAQVMADLLQGIVQQFSATVANTIVDAFDPNKKVDLKQRFAEFLQGIAKLILQTLTQIAVTKAILSGLSFLGAGLADGGEVQGKAAGGRIGSGGRASAAHFAHAEGYFHAGMIRPRGLDPRDTTPIWAQPGEFMQPVAAVNKYGLGFMEAVRTLSLDPIQLRGLDTPSVSFAPSAPSFASGGAVTAEVGGDSQGGGVQVLPAIVTTPSEMGRLFDSSRSEFMRFARKHAPELENILAGVRRRQ